MQLGAVLLTATVSCGIGWGVRGAYDAAKADDRNDEAVESTDEGGNF